MYAENYLNDLFMFDFTDLWCKPNHLCGCRILLRVCQKMRLHSLLFIQLLPGITVMQMTHQFLNLLRLQIQLGKLKYILLTSYFDNIIISNLKETHLQLSSGCCFEGSKWYGWLGESPQNVHHQMVRQCFLYYYMYQYPIDWFYIGNWKLILALKEGFHCLIISMFYE